MRYIDHIRNMSDDQLAYFLNAIQPEITLWSLSMMRALSRKPYKGVDALNGTNGDTRTLMSILYKAFIEFVKNDNIKPWSKVCIKYGIDRPKSWKVERAGIYKAVQYCTNIPEDVKVLAMQKCLELGFSPLIKPYESQAEKEDKE